MKLPGKTSVARMQRTAMLEAERIEIVQDHWVKEGAITEPVPYMVQRRDDLMGVVRMIDAINSDPDLLDRVKKRMAALASAADAAMAAPATTVGGEDATIDDSEVAD
ncbi:hypothetical protein [Bradyrhizobium sp. YR681]|uniref:hypothetical protein n=1 Tax=Bradyrhizobium sp. YR681 TaxID=1144344 RepID=UPI0012F63EA4|nr:hypothetical protein [Bradyrhizobium sp. YR681]